MRPRLPRCGLDAAGKKELGGGLLGFMALNVNPFSLTPFTGSIYSVSNSERFARS